MDKKGGELCYKNGWGIEEREVIYEEKSFEDQLINKERAKTMGG